MSGARAQAQASSNLLALAMEKIPSHLKSDYSEDLDPHQWAWAFMRRNEEYQKESSFYLDKIENGTFPERKGQISISFTQAMTPEEIKKYKEFQFKWNLIIPIDWKMPAKDFWKYNWNFDLIYQLSPFRQMEPNFHETIGKRHHDIESNEEWGQRIRFLIESRSFFVSEDMTEAQAIRDFKKFIKKLNLPTNRQSLLKKTVVAMGDVYKRNRAFGPENYSNRLFSDTGVLGNIEIYERRKYLKVLDVFFEVGTYQSAGYAYTGSHASGERDGRCYSEIAQKYMKNYHIFFDYS